MKWKGSRTKRTRTQPSANKNTCDGRRSGKRNWRGFLIVSLLVGLAAPLSVADETPGTAQAGAQADSELLTEDFVQRMLAAMDEGYVEREELELLVWLLEDREDQMRQRDDWKDAYERAQKRLRDCVAAGNEAEQDAVKERRRKRTWRSIALTEGGILAVIITVLLLVN